MSLKISQFFATDYVDYSSYDNTRSISSYIDGLNISGRKCLYTIKKKNIKEFKKVSQIISQVSEFTNYLHGEDSLTGVLINYTSNYIGSNNLPLYEGNGNFGKRCKNEAGAKRYIFLRSKKYLEYLFNDEDDNILNEQSFEGDKIEPQFYVPLLPMILINGSEGISMGFAQKILPRNPLEIKNKILDILNNKENIERIFPYYKNFEGKIELREENTNSWNIIGKFEFENNNKKKIKITELPIGYELLKYRKILEDLEERKIINSFIDLTDTKKDKFLFEVTLKNSEDFPVLENLKLIKRVTENFTCLNEFQKIQVFNNEIDLLHQFIKIRLEFYKIRKENKIKEIENKIKIIKNKLLFIKNIISGEIILNKKPKENIILQCEDKKIEKINDNYDYLLNLPIYSLTLEKLNDLMEQFKKENENLKEIQNKDVILWYKEELEHLFKQI